MAAWPGGPCPDCGDDMPPNMLRCMTCRRWLNEDLKRPEPPVPEHFDLPEITSEMSHLDNHAEATVEGHYVVCPCCQKELRIADRYVGENVACKFCQESFVFSPQAGTLRRVGVYVSCTHCHNELRVARKYLGQRVVCRFCSGRIQLPSDQTASV